MGAVAAAVVTFFTFLPSFLFILLGAPFIESTHGNLKFTAPLTGITAAVVGVIVNLAVFFAYHVLWPQGLGGRFEGPSAVIGVAAAAALFRFRDMGIEPFLVASSLIGVVGQRLVRKICPTCVEEYQPTEHQLRVYEYLGGQDKATFVRGAGCTFCAGTGYRERVAVYEVLEVTDEIGQLLVGGSTPHEVRELAIKQGMRTMAEEAVALVGRDVTTIDEILRNVYIV